MEERHLRIGKVTSGSPKNRNALAFGDPIMESSKSNYFLFYDVVDNYIERRAPYRDQHIQLAQSLHGQGMLLLGGPLDDPVDGAVLVFRVNDPKIIEDFVQRDPYVQNGLVKAWRIRKWNTVIGKALLGD